MLAALVLAGCGGGARQDASEPSGNFPVAVTTATFPGSQRLSEHTHLVLAVRNTGSKTIPNVAVTICNVTCAYPAPPGEGTDAAAFADDLQQTGLANPSRPIWIVDRPPGACNVGCQPGSTAGSGSPGGAVTAYSNTWALGSLRAGPDGQVRLGRDRGGARAPRRRLGGGRRPQRQGQGRHSAAARSRTGRSRSDPQRAVESYVNNNGQIVTTTSSAP